MPGRGAAVVARTLHAILLGMAAAVIGAAIVANPAVPDEPARLAIFSTPFILLCLMGDAKPSWVAVAILIAVAGFVLVLGGADAELLRWLYIPAYAYILLVALLRALVPADYAFAAGVFIMDLMPAMAYQILPVVYPDALVLWAKLLGDAAMIKLLIATGIIYLVAIALTWIPIKTFKSPRM